MRLYGLLAVYLLCFPWRSFGQVQEAFTVTDKPLRIEIPVQSDKETYRIIPCDSAGMILFFKSVEVTPENATRWYFSYFDRNLQRVWVKSAPILSFLNFRESFVESDTLYLCFESDKKQKNSEINFQILRIVLLSGSFILNNGKIPEQGVISSFTAGNQKALLGLNNNEHKPSILIMDLPTGQSSVIPLMPNDQSTLLYGPDEPLSGTLTLLISKMISKRSSELYLAKYQTDGTLVSETKITGNNPSYEITSAILTDIGESETMIAGVYSAIPSGKKNRETGSTGFTTISFVSVVQKSIDYYNFLDMKNIQQLLSEQDLLSLRKKSMKKSHADQEYSLDFSLLLHDIMEWEDQFILAAEAYFPQYHTESFTDYDFYGRPYTNSYSVFDGYRFTGVILAGFNKEGKLIWDNSMRINNLISFSLDPKVTLYPSGDELILTYLSEGKIACRIIRESETVEKTTYSEMELMSPNDKLLDESGSSMVYWYDDFFLCSGYQEIRDISKGGNDKRMVYFCNKVQFDR